MRKETTYYLLTMKDKTVYFIQTMNTLGNKSEFTILNNFICKCLQNEVRFN
jgi:hypothetical protein